MTPAEAQGVRALIVSSLSQALRARGFDLRTLSDDFDLRAQGVIDSLGFILLIGDLEAKIGVRINLADLDPEKLTNLGALSGHVAAQLTSNRGRSIEWRSSLRSGL